MAIHSDDPKVVEKSSRHYLTPRPKEAMSPSGVAATTKHLNDKISDMELIGSMLWENLLDMEAEKLTLDERLIALEGGDNLVEQVNAHADLVEQFQILLDQDADDMKASATELGVNFKGNTPHRDILSSCFKVMCEKMLGTEAPSEEG